MKSAGRRRLSGGRGFSILQTASAVWELPIAENARICYDTPMRGNYGMTTVIIGGGAAGMAAAITLPASQAWAPKVAAEPLPYLPS